MLEAGGGALLPPGPGVDRPIAAVIEATSLGIAFSSAMATDLSSEVTATPAVALLTGATWLVVADVVVALVVWVLIAIAAALSFSEFAAALLLLQLAKHPGYWTGL